MKAQLAWQQGMEFACENHGIKTSIDATKEHGGTDKGPSPKDLVLNAMMGCTAMDVVAILNKMRQPLVRFAMEIEVEKTLEHPVHFKTALLVFFVEGPVAPDKLLKAVEVSLTRYCGVNYMISRSCDISYRVNLNGALVGTGKARFAGDQ